MLSVCYILLFRISLLLKNDFQFQKKQLFIIFLEKKSQNSTDPLPTPISALREKCPYLEFFWYVFSRIWTRKTSNTNTFHAVLHFLKAANSPGLFVWSCLFIPNVLEQKIINQWNAMHNFLLISKKFFFWFTQPDLAITRKYFQKTSILFTKLFIWIYIWSFDLRLVYKIEIPIHYLGPIKHFYLKKVWFYFHITLVYETEQIR